MKIKQVLNIDSKEFVEMMTEEEYSRMRNLGIEYPHQLLDLMQDGAKENLKDKTPDSNFVTISEYLNYLEEQKEYSKEIQDLIDEGYIPGQGFYREQTIDNDEEEER